MVDAVLEERRRFHAERDGVKEIRLAELALAVQRLGWWRSTWVSP
jgi:hypothetical protein